MNLYRLLRSNKETGPYTQEEMITHGFKPYDLIWVEGKSAGWRYPSELAEFKTYCPVTEEQPYDRFYKKPAPQVSRLDKVEKKIQPETYATSYTSQTTSTVKEVKEKENKPAPSIIPFVPVEVEQPAGKHIHVTLPAGAVIKTIVKKEEPKEKPISEQVKAAEPVKRENIVSFEEEVTAQLVPVIEMQTNTYRSAQPAYMQEDPVKRKEPVAAKAPVFFLNNMAAQVGGYSWTMILGIAVGIATFIGLGLMIGLSINRNRDNEAFNNAIIKKLDRIAAPVNSQPVKEEKPANNNLTEQQPSNNTALDPGIVKNAVIKTTPVQNQPTASAQTKTPPLTANTGKESRPMKENDIAKEPVHPKTEPLPAPNLEKQVLVNNNLYKVGAFGGISELQCTLTNESRYTLDMVEVEVSYIQANEKIYKTEILSFRDVAAGAQVTINAPKSPRGIKVISRVVKINSKENGAGNTTVRS